MPLRTALLLATFTASWLVLAQQPSERTTNNGNLVMQDIPEIPARIATQLNRYQNVRSAPFRAFNQDGSAIYISTRFGDVSQLHRVEMAGGARQQLTFFDEPIGSVERRPDSQTLAFTMDAGGSENAQIFLLDPDTGVSRMVTDGKSRNGQIEWSPEGGLLAFTSTMRNGRNNDIWYMDTNHADPQSELLLEATDGSWWGTAGWSPDNQKVLLQRYISASDSRTYLMDVASKEMQPLDGSEQNPSSNYVSAMGHDGNGYYFRTDQNGEFTQLAYRSFKDDSLTIITADISWDVNSFSLSHDGKRGAFSVNQDGISAVYLLDTATFNYQKVQGLPLGVTRGLSFSPDDKHLALTLNTAKTPSDTFMLALKPAALAHGDLTRWTHSEVGGLKTDSFVEPELVRFTSFDDLEIPAFVYKPAGNGPHPVIISIHGGPEGQARPTFSSTYQMWINTLDAAVVVPNVRGSRGYGKAYLNMDNGFKREDSVKDIGALLDWIATQPDLDQSRVAVFGGSYGGYMVLASAMHYSDRLKAAVDVVGISNFVTFLKNTKDYRRDLRRVEYGDEREEAMHDFLQKISPSNNVDKIKVPMFVVQGQNDPRVPVTEAEQIVKALRDDGKTVWYMNALNEGHGFRKKENRDVYQQATVLFFENHLVK